uniref:Tetratricopeptide repeat-containing protein n=1 Tax=Candidatus Kentrum sp. MB TaxID=2138164 RepID=A0A451B885_9GAMM|nr:MAG: Tetratricopeptide repeat-containing protein [Candidatus Kentron sp. MB]
MEPEQIGDAARESDIFESLFDPNLSKQPSHRLSEPQADNDNADKRIGEIDPLETVVTGTTPPGRYKKILLFGVFPLFLTTLSAGIYLFKTSHEISHASKENFPPFLESAPTIRTSIGVKKSDMDVINESPNPAVDQQQMRAKVNPKDNTRETSRPMWRETSDDRSGFNGKRGLEKTAVETFTTWKPIRPNGTRMPFSKRVPSFHRTSAKIGKDNSQQDITSQSEPNQIKINRAQIPNYLHTTLMAGFDAFKQGDDGTATTTYQSVLEKQPNNRDALLGLAAIAMHKRQWGIAANHYFRILRHNPGNTTAQAALLGLQNNMDPVVGENQIKRLLKKEPNAPYLHFSLGNFYSRQSRWLEAEQAYFKAYRADDTNADYAYNLAISLDHLAKRRAAPIYYRRALDLLNGTSQSAGFDPAIVQQRIEAIEKQQP